MNFRDYLNEGFSPGMLKEKLGESNSLSPFVKELKQMCMKAGADMSKFKCSLDYNGANDDYLNINLYIVFSPRNDRKNFDIVLSGGDIGVYEYAMNKNIFVTSKLSDESCMIHLQDIIQNGDKIVKMVKMAKEAVKIEEFIKSHKYSDLLS